MNASERAKLEATADHLGYYYLGREAKVRAVLAMRNGIRRDPSFNETHDDLDGDWTESITAQEGMGL